MNAGSSANARASRVLRALLEVEACASAPRGFASVVVMRPRACAGRRNRGRTGFTQRVRRRTRDAAWMSTCANKLGRGRARERLDERNRRGPRTSTCSSASRSAASLHLLQRKLVRRRRGALTCSSERKWQSPTEARQVRGTSTCASASDGARRATRIRKCVEPLLAPAQVTEPDGSNADRQVRGTSLAPAQVTEAGPALRSIRTIHGPRSNALKCSEDRGSAVTSAGQQNCTRAPCRGAWAWRSEWGVSSRR